MPWISYAQNREDVLLRRAFKDVRAGFYVDVGACDPIELSVTKTFYDQGWNGINIEASPTQWAIVARGRPRDINLNVGCSNRRGKMTFFKARGDATGLSTFVAEEVEKHEKNGFSFDRMDTPVTTLADICIEHVGDRTIDFIKIDVEGHEREVIEGGDWKRFRPRVALVEATRPMSTESTHQRWEHILLGADYLYATFDGLNRYYVRREDAHLKDALVTPPNVFDDFVPYEYQRRIDALQAELEAYRGSHPVVSGALRAAKFLNTAASALRDRVRAPFRRFSSSTAPR